ncbi:zinc knuckle CX2CX4HX4C containing protein [Tanacetum coccineum]
MEHGNLLRSCFIVGKDGKPMKAMCNVQFEAATRNLEQEVDEFVSATDDSVCLLNNGGEDAKESPKTTSIADGDVDSASLVIPIKAVEEVSSRFANTLYGYFIGKRLAFPVVENYVKNTWAKFGLKRVMLQNGFFFCQFATREGMERVIESGSWLIRLVPLILNVWTPNSKLKKDEITSTSLWVKLHNVPIVAY